jgi:hypothetical protein
MQIINDHIFTPDKLIIIEEFIDSNLTNNSQADIETNCYVDMVPLPCLAQNGPIRSQAKQALPIEPC